MPAPVFVVLAALTLLSILAANRLAHRQERAPVPWMVASALFGPFPLIPLALLRSRAGQP